MLGYWKASSKCTHRGTSHTKNSKSGVGYSGFTASVVSKLYRPCRKFTTSIPQISVEDLNQLKTIQIRKQDSTDSSRAYLTKNAEAKYKLNSENAWRELHDFMDEKKKRFYDGIGPIDSVLLNHPDVFGPDYQFEKKFMQKMQAFAKENPYMKEQVEAAFDELFTPENSDVLKRTESPFWNYRNRLRESYIEAMVNAEAEVENNKELESELQQLGVGPEDEPGLLDMNQEELDKVPLPELKSGLNKILHQFFQSIEQEEERKQVAVQYKIVPEEEINNYADEQLQNAMKEWANQFTSSSKPEILHAQLAVLRHEYAVATAMSLIGDHLSELSLEDVRKIALKFNIPDSTQLSKEEINNAIVGGYEETFMNLADDEIAPFTKKVTDLVSALCDADAESLNNTIEMTTPVVAPSANAPQRKVGSFGKELLKLRQNAAIEPEAEAEAETAAVAPVAPSQSPMEEDEDEEMELEPEAEADFEDDVEAAFKSRENAMNFLLKYSAIIGLDPKIEEEIRMNYKSLIQPVVGPVAELLPEDFPQVKEANVPPQIVSLLKSKVDEDQQIFEAANMLESVPLNPKPTEATQNMEQEFLHHIITSLEDRMNEQKDEELEERIIASTLDIERASLSSNLLLKLANLARFNRRKIMPAATKFKEALMKDLEQGVFGSEDLLATFQDMLRVCQRITDPDEIHKRISEVLDQVDRTNEELDVFDDFERFVFAKEEVSAASMLVNDEDVTKTTAYLLAGVKERAFLKHENQISNLLKEAYQYYANRLKQNPKSSFTTTQQRRVLDLMHRSHPLIQEIMNPMIIQWSPVKDLVSNELQLGVTQAKIENNFSRYTDESYQKYINKISGLPESVPNEIVLLDEPPMSFPEYLLQKTKALYATKDYQKQEAAKIAALKAEKESLERSISAILFQSENQASSDAIIRQPSTPFDSSFLNTIIQFKSSELTDTFPENPAGNLAFDAEILFKGEKAGLLVRSHAIELASQLQQCQQQGFDPKQTPSYLLLDGPKGSGKSQVLNLLVFWARKNGWLVNFFSSGYSFANPSTIDISATPNTVETPNENSRWCATMIKAHSAELQKLELKLPLDKPMTHLKEKATFHGKTLAALLEWGVKYPNFSGQVLAHYRKELNLVTEFPVLVVVDEINSWWNSSKWYDIDSPLETQKKPPALSPKKFVVPNAFSNFQNHGLANGMFIASTSTSLSMKNFQKSHKNVASTVIPNFTLQEWQSLLRYHELCQIWATKESTAAVRNYWFKLCDGNAKEMISLYRKTAF